MHPWQNAIKKQTEKRKQNLSINGPQKEHRNIRVAKLALRAKANGSNTIAGKIAYNSRSQDLGGFVEIIAPGAFTDSLRTNEVLAYWSHESDQILGRQGNGTLRIKDTPTALTFECDLDTNTTWGANALAAFKRGDVKSNSFGFSIDNTNGNGDTWRELNDGTILRTVNKALLWEVSPVGVPAYSANDTSLLRNAPAAIRTKLLKRDDVECDCACDNCTDADEDAKSHDCTNEEQRCALYDPENAFESDTDDSRSLVSSIILKKLALLS